MVNFAVLMHLHSQSGNSNSSPWDFGSGSYNNKKAKAKLKGEKYEGSSDEENQSHKPKMQKLQQPSKIEDEFDDFGLNSDED